VVVGDDGARDEVLKLEERFWLQGGGDPDFWRTHFAEDGVVALPFGLLDKEQTVAAMEQAQPWATVRMDDLRVVPISDTVVLVAYRATGTRTDADDYVAVVGSTYVRREGGWKLLFHQQSPVADPPTA
jgi:hypothetical protein